MRSQLCTQAPAAADILQESSAKPSKHARKHAHLSCFACSPALRSHSKRSNVARRVSYVASGQGQNRPLHARLVDSWRA